MRIMSTLDENYVSAVTTWFWQWQRMVGACGTCWAAKIVQISDCTANLKVRLEIRIHHLKRKRISPCTRKNGMVATQVKDWSSKKHSSEEGWRRHSSERAAHV